MSPAKKSAADLDHYVSQAGKSLTWVPVNELRVDHRYQRALDMVRVRRMARDFDDDAFGVLILSQRDDGSLWIIDGQHRAALMGEIGWSDQSVPAIVHTGLTLELEAKIFAMANSGSRPNAIALYKAQLVQGDPEVIDIDHTIRRVGLQIAPGGGQGIIQAAAAVRTVYHKTGGLTLERVLRHIVAAWGSDSSNFQADILLALALIEQRYGRDRLNRDHLRRALSTTTANSLVARARATKASGSGNIWSGDLPVFIIQAYNKGLKTNRLPDWERRTNVREVWT